MENRRLTTRLISYRFFAVVNLMFILAAELPDDFPALKNQIL